jgi:alpha-aminoadipic semialdehyde synthase
VFHFEFSLLPAPLHPKVARSCIKLKKHMVTTSYISKELEDMNPAAQEAGIVILNESGLDPGLDHLSAKKLIDEVHEAGEAVESFISWCGGLPAPEHADNPFGYKFSWRPQGVLSAAQNPATYLLNGQYVNVRGENLLKSARPIKIHNALSFEGLPNRNSLVYAIPYGLDGVKTMFRGTLRYRV